MTGEPSPQPPALNLNELNFDTCSRLRSLDHLLTQLEVGNDALILDIGGYPCTMARAYPQRNIVTADIYAKGHPPYVRASGAALPFPDNAFEVTFACDVLEHVPPAYRDPFLGELSRVSSRAVIVAGPYDTPGTSRAESVVRNLLPKSSPAQTWLAEHHEFGLPSLRGTIDALLGYAFDARAIPVSPLTEWILLFAGQAAGERHHRVSEAMARFVERFNHLQNGVAQPAGGCVAAAQGPSYRYAVVSARSEDTRHRLEAIAPAVEPAVDAEAVEAYVEALGELFTAVLSAGQMQDSSMGDSKGDGISADYIQRLERMLSHRGMAVPSPGGATKSRGSRIREALKILFQ